MKLARFHAKTQEFRNDEKGRLRRNLATPQIAKRFHKISAKMHSFILNLQGESMRLSKYDYTFFGFVAIYAFAIIYKAPAPLMSGDDIGFFMDLREGRAVWHGFNLDYGRFFPLAGWNLNVVALFSTSPLAFMAFNAICFTITALCYYALACSFNVAKSLVLFSFVLLALSVGYVKIITQITFPEMTQIMLLMLFLLCVRKILLYSTSDSAKDSKHSNIYIYIYAILAIILANGVIYLKEVSFILISGFGFFHLLFSYLNHRFFQLQKIPAKIIIFDCVLMFSGIVFLTLYFYLTLNATHSYTKLENVFSPTRTFIVAILATPFISIVTPLMLVYRIYVLFKEKSPLKPFSDSLLVVSFGYFCAFLVLGMGSFHYFMPASFLCCLYMLVFLRDYGERLYKKIAFKLVVALVGFIMLFNAIPQGLHYFTLNKTQMRNMEQSMAFLADYIAKNPNTTLYFDGFCRGRDRCYGYLQYSTIFEILPRIYNARHFDIKSSEPNGVNFTIDSKAKFSFFSSDEVSVPQSGDLLIVSFMSDKAISKQYLQNLQSDNELLFKSDNFGYFPSYNLMSLGAYILQKCGVKHALSNVGNPFKTPSQFYIFKIR